MIVTSLVKTGTGKEMCDDAVFNGKNIITYDDVRVTEIVNDNNTWIAIADGVGGNAGGHDASKYLLDYINENYQKSIDDTQLQSVLKKANKSLVEYAKESNGKENMATTFTGIFWDDDNIKIAHVGNTRIYAVQGNYLKQITVDHTTYQWLMMQGNYEAANNCNRSEIISCFGGGDETLIKMLSVESIPLENVPHILIMTTDGIHDYVDIDTFEEIVAAQLPTEEIINNLWENAKDRGSSDDCSIIIVEW